MKLVMIVDDNAVNQTVLGRMLTRRGCTIERATDGVEAVALARSIAPDLILMDLSMPRMDGFDAAREILAGEAHGAPIFAVTANVTEENRRRCAEIGFAGFVSKPVMTGVIDELLARIPERDAPPD